MIVKFVVNDVVYVGIPAADDQLYTSSDGLEAVLGLRDLLASGSLLLYLRPVARYASADRIDLLRNHLKSLGKVSTEA